MRSLRNLALLLLIVPIALTQVSQPALLPPVSGYALDRTRVSLPGDFATPWNLLILLFQRDQEPLVDAWAQAIPAMPGVQVWLMPVSTRENGVYRWWLNASFRSSLPAAQPRHYVLPVYVDKPQFLRSLEITSEQDVVLLLTDKSGRVFWRTSGPLADDKKAALLSFVSKSGAH
jgi:hypothetical protein